MKALTSLMGLVVCASLAGVASARAEAVVDGNEIASQAMPGTLMADASPSPDGTSDEPCADVPLACGKIAFVSARDGNPEIYSANVDGTGIERLTNAPQNDDEPAWSPDGQRIAFVSDRSLWFRRRARHLMGQRGWEAPRA